jgi:hypothetical protein
LPYIEQGSLYDEINVNGGTGALTMNDKLPSGVRVRQVVLKAVRCASDIAADLDSCANGFDADGGSAPTSYKGVCGSNWAWGGIKISKPGGSDHGLNRGNGIFDRRMKEVNGSTNSDTGTYGFSDILDGTSNTFMIGESSNKYANHTGCWTNFNHTTGTCAHPLNYRKNDGTPWSRTDWGRTYTFHSYHPSGGQFAFADASVSLVEDGINIDTYRALATRAGSESAMKP